VRTTRSLVALVAMLALIVFWNGLASIATVSTVGGGANCTNPAKPAVLPRGMRLGYCDDFEGTSLDPARWYPNWFTTTDCSVIGGGAGSQTVNTPRPTNVSVSGGYLHLTTRHENASCYGQTFPYTSALIETGGHYNGSTHQYDTPPQFTCTAPCYVEVRFKMPSSGPWPAIWMEESPANGQWVAGHELDNLEQWGKSFRTWRMHVHLLCNGAPASGGNDFKGPDTTSAFHTSGLWWQASRIDWYADKRLSASYTGCGIPQPGTPYYLLLNGGVIGNLGEPPASLPWEMLVDYVRIWTA